MLKQYRQTVYENALRKRNGIYFNPSSITGLSLWLDAADISTTTFSTGSNVIQWTDKSGSANNATKDPGDVTMITTFVNGIQAIEFLYGRMLFETPKLFAGTTSSSVFIVIKPSTTSTGHPIGTRLDFDSHFNVDNVLYENIGFSERQTMGALYPPSILQIYENIANDGGDTYLYKNGIEVGKKPYGNGYTLADFSIGAASFFYGTICEILIYNSALSTINRQTVEAYLAAKWGLQETLPIAHLYKSGAP